MRYPSGKPRSDAAPPSSGCSNERQARPPTTPAAPGRRTPPAARRRRSRERRSARAACPPRDRTTGARRSPSRYTALRGNAGIAPRVERRLDARGSEPVVDVAELHVRQARLARQAGTRTTARARRARPRRSGGRRSSSAGCSRRVIARVGRDARERAAREAPLDFDGCAAAHRPRSAAPTRACCRPSASTKLKRAPYVRP